MPRLIRDGEIVEDNWLAPNPDEALPQHIPTLAQWALLDNKSGSAVQLEPGDGVSPLLADLAGIRLIAISFPVFTDGRGFSYARELRQRGYTGELRAVGHFIADQLHYLSRCGFNAFQFEKESTLEESLPHIQAFSEHYQAAIDQPLPLFRRRAQG